MLTRPDTRRPPGGVAQLVQIDDLRVTFQIDQPERGPRVADVLVDGAGSSPTVNAMRLRFTMSAMDMAAIETDTQIENASDLTFSPDATRIAFLCWHPDSAAFTLDIATPDGQNERELIGSSAFSSRSSLRFSPDGHQIIFIAIGGPATEPQGYPLAQRDRSPLDRLLGLFAPAVAEAHDATADLWIVNIDGTGLRRLTKMNADTLMAVFSPDGQTIALMSAGGMYLMNADGANLRKIAALGDHGGLDWAR